MTGDAAPREPDAQPVDLRSLPDVVALEVRHVQFGEPLRRYVTPGEVAEYGDAIELEVTTATELPIRSYPPALYVGEVMVADVEQVDRNRYIFRAFDATALPEGAPIVLGWPDDTERRRSTRFRYEPPPSARGTRRPATR